MTDEIRTVSVIGTGRMGAAMASRIAGAGFRTVVWNRTTEKAAAVARDVGCEIADSAAEACASADVVVCSLADDAALVEAHTGPGGILEGIRAGAVVVETSTVDPETITSVAGHYLEAGASLLDAPVSGSVSLVEQGALTSMAGGDDAALSKARPVIETYSKTVFHLGRNGTGATMKLAVNSLVHATNLAIAEALVLAEKAGVDREKTYEVFASSAASSPFLQYKRQAFERPGEVPVAFSLDLVNKDLELILDLARRVGAPMEQLDATAELTRRAVSAGMGADDMSALAVLLRESGHTPP